MLQGHLVEARTSVRYSPYVRVLCVAAYWAHETVDLLTKETLDFIPPTLWPPNSLNLNLVDYKVWLAMQEKVYKPRIKDVNQLLSHNLTAWDKLNQHVIAMAVRQQRIRLRVCATKSRHFEHRLIH